MQFALLIYEGREQFGERTRPEGEAFWGPWRIYQRALVDAGIYIGGSPLEGPDSAAATVRVRGGEQQVQDGPYADTKEQLGGFILLELPSLVAAREWAARCPAAAYGAVEVRALADLTEIFGPDPTGFGRG
jgi:hypothetical protein